MLINTQVLENTNFYKALERWFNKDYSAVKFVTFFALNLLSIKTQHLNEEDKHNIDCIHPLGAK